MKMKISEKYINLTDCIVYNQFYALKYPEEDRTNLEKEYKEITKLFSELRASLKSDYKLQQLTLASKEIEDAFDMYRGGKDGYKKMENALEYIDRSRKKAPPKTNFFSGSKGIVRL